MSSKMNISIVNDKEILNRLEKEKKSVLSSAEKALKLVGLDGETLAMQGAPVDTGRLKNSMTHQLGNDFVVIGTNVEYAIYLEVNGRHKGWFRRVYNQLIPRAKLIFQKETKR
jgi:phage gpG-like protein